MSHNYQLILLHQQQQARATELRQALRDRARRLKLPDASLSIDDNPSPPAGSASLTGLDTNPRLVLFLAGPSPDTGTGHPGLAEQWHTGGADSQLQH